MRPDEAARAGTRFASPLPATLAAATRPRTVLIAVALVLAAIHARELGSWLVDDAGVTFAFARNLARGHGLVAQPGTPPLEGFSNPLWTFLLAPFFALGAFHAVWTPKALAFAGLSAALALVVRGVRAEGGAAWFAGLAAVLLALDSAVVIWAASGLENPLLALLLAVSATLALRASSGDPPRLDAAAGIVAGLLALTRPDAVLFAAAYPVALAFDRRAPLRASLRTRLAPYLLAFSAVFGSYLVFRRLYFGDWVPNTYHAKVKPWMASLDVGRPLELVQSAVGRAAWPALALLAVWAAASLRRREGASRLAVLGAYIALAAAAYVLLPPDWMGEYRFATGFFVFFYWMLGEALAWLWTEGRRGGLRWLAPAAAALLLVESATIHAARTAEFARGPIVPFERIREFARGYDRLAEALGRGPHSLLTPDLGGQLFDSRLRIYDLAGLCDRTIARTLMTDGPAFRDYVFETTRPTFLHVHGSWADWARFHGDPRLARDYVVLAETWERPPGAEAGTGEPWAGDYVRRDALPASVGPETLRAEFRRLGLDRPLP